MTLRIPSLMPGGHVEEHESIESAGAEAPQDPNTPLTTPFAHETVGLDPDSSLLKSKYGGVAVLLFVLVVAGATLFGMRSLGRAGSIALIDIKIDYPLDATSNASLKDQQLVLQDLRSSGQLKQVPLEEVQMNPFEWKGLGPDTRASARSSSMDPAEAERRAREARQKQIEVALSRLRLNSTIGGRVPMASISGEMVKVGSTVGEFFTVEAIDGRSVTLVADGQQYVLTPAK